ncbi:hypothetical protein [Citrifermentans bremense]|nr:hypothetical protein [Citrifermentans bremense]
MVDIRCRVIRPRSQPVVSFQRMRQIADATIPTAVQRIISG